MPMWCGRQLCRWVILPLVSILSWRTRKWPSIRGIPEAVHRDGDPIDGERTDERVDHFPGRFAWER
jgi:hypothetical protein